MSLTCRALVDHPAPQAPGATFEAVAAHPAGLLFGSGSGPADELTPKRLAKIAHTAAARDWSFIRERIMRPRSHQGQAVAVLHKQRLAQKDAAQRAKRPHPAGDLCCVNPRPQASPRSTNAPTWGAQSSKIKGAHPAGLLFGVRDEEPFSKRHPKLLETRAYANARCWPAVGLLTAPHSAPNRLIEGIEKLQEKLQEQDELGVVGVLFVRFKRRDSLPDVASSRLDLCLSIARLGADLFEQLSTSANPQHADDVLADSKALGAQAFLEAGMAADLLIRELTNHARAMVQDGALKATPLFQQPKWLAPHMQEMLLFHNTLLAWPHADELDGALSNSPSTRSAIEGWTDWQNSMLARIDGLVGPSLAAEFSGQSATDASP